MNGLSCPIFKDETKILKKRARSAVNLVAFAAIISTLLTYLFFFAEAFALPFIARLIESTLIGMGENRLYAEIFAENFLNSEEFNWFMSILGTLLCSFLPFAVISKTMFGMNAEDAAPVKGKIMGSFPFVHCMSLVMSTVASMVAGGIFSFLFPDAYQMSATEIVEIYGTSSSIASLVLSFLAMCVVAPFAEEFIYRGVMFGYLKKHGVYFAAFCSSLIFGLAHATVDQIAYAFVFGFVLCMVTYRTGNLKTAVLMHLTNNFVGYFQAYLMPFLGLEDYVFVFEAVYSIIVGIFAVAGVIFWFASGNKRKETSEEPAENAPLSCFLTIGTVLVAVFAVINVLLGLVANG